jgi:hypothetical protein
MAGADLAAYEEAARKESEAMWKMIRLAEAVAKYPPEQPPPRKLMSLLADAARAFEECHTEAERLAPTVGEE